MVVDVYKFKTSYGLSTQLSFKYFVDHSDINYLGSEIFPGTCHYLATVTCHNLGLNFAKLKLSTSKIPTYSVRVLVKP